MDHKFCLKTNTYDCFGKRACTKQFGKALTMNNRKYVVAVAALSAFVTLTGCATANTNTNTTTAPRATLPAFKNEQEIRDLFKGWHDEQQRRVAAQRRQREEARALMQEQSGMGSLSSARTGRICISPV